MSLWCKFIVISVMNNIIRMYCLNLKSLIHKQQLNQGKEETNIFALFFINILFCFNWFWCFVIILCHWWSFKSFSVINRWFFLHESKNRIYGVMVSVLASSTVDRGFEHRSGKTKDYKIGICCFSAQHAALRRKNKDCLARNQDNVSE